MRTSTSVCGSRMPPSLPGPQEQRNCFTFLTALRHLPKNVSHRLQQQLVAERTHHLDALCAPAETLARRKGKERVTVTGLYLYRMNNTFKPHTPCMLPLTWWRQRTPLRTCLIHCSVCPHEVLLPPHLDSFLPSWHCQCHCESPLAIGWQQHII